ncbi:HIRAN domain-containing protein [Staphylococcus simulans]|uniref:HIRAN domain-containing protein n=1 Tax=Staphylococcus simulans TaxID=1286 RepID=UPI0033652014
MKGKSKDKLYLLNQFSNFEIIAEATASSNIDGVIYNGSIFISYDEFTFVNSKKQILYKIPWSHVNSLTSQKGILSNKTFINYDQNSKELVLQFTSNEFIVLEALYKTFCHFNKKINNTDNLELQDKIEFLEKENEKLLSISKEQNDSSDSKLVLEHPIDEKIDDLSYESFVVVGLNYDDRGNRLKKMISDMKKNEEFIYLYEGLKRSELINELEFGGKLFEIANYESIPGVYLERDTDNPYDTNAIKVIISNEYGKFIVGYVPRENATAINQYVENINTCTAYIYGGKYKEFDWIEEKLVTKEKPYGLNLMISYYK